MLGHCSVQTVTARLHSQCENTCAILNTVAGGFVIAPDKYASTGAFCAEGLVGLSNAPDVAIINPITADGETDLAAYYQVQKSEDGFVNVRVLFLSDINYVTAASELNIKVVFTRGGETVKTYNGKLGNEVYKSVSAGDDYYFAPNGIAMFGNIFTGVPTAEANAFTVTVTDSTGATVYTAEGSIR